MFPPPPSTRVFLCLQHTDMRKSFDTLAALVTEVVRENPLSGHLFVFRNRHGDRLKVLYWDRAGFCLVYKRLEKGTFRFPVAAVIPAQPTSTTSRAEPGTFEIDGGELALIIEGIDLDNAHRRKRFVLPATAAGAPVI